MIHRLGFEHEQTRSDRDEFVEIFMENVPADFQNQFDIDAGNLQDFKYDYGSIMHYERTIFEDDDSHPKLAMLPRMNPCIEIGQRRGFSEYDILKMNKWYQCPQYEEMPIVEGTYYPTTYDTETQWAQKLETGTFLFQCQENENGVVVPKAISCLDDDLIEQYQNGDEFQSKGQNVTCVISEDGEDYKLESY